MSRIGHQVPLSAYDHIAKRLDAAGGADGVISRADADKLVKELEAAGKGTEALAARNLFKMIDARDAAAGARVTGYDLAKERTFVEEKMLENRDANRNGFSRDEIAKMSPTARALIELGRVLQIGASAGRIAHRIPREGLNHTAALLRQAAGADGITSRKDLETLADKLYTEGRGTEALAVRTFFSFLDHRDAAPGARITGKDIERAVAYANEHLLENKDGNRNGYSIAETEKFSKSAKAFLLLGQMIEEGILKSAATAVPAKAKPAAGASGKDIEQQLAKVIGGLELDDFGSEGGQAFETVHVPGHKGELTEASFRKAFGMEADTPDNVIERFEPLPSAFLEEFVDAHERYYPAPAGENARKVADLLRGLKDVKVVITGEDGTTDSVHPTYLIGTAPDGSLVGLKSGVVWT